MTKENRIIEIKNNFLEAQRVLNEYINNPVQWTSITEAGEIMINAISAGNKIISCGNGGSMCDAMHFAEELSGRFRNDRKPLAAISISDSSHITCTANDYGFKYVFSRYVETLGKPGDILLAISTSGNSENIVEAALSAKKTGMAIIALTGKNGGQLSELCDVEIRAPKSDFSDRVQEIHIKVIHSLVHYIEMGLSL